MRRIALRSRTEPLPQRANAHQEGPVHFTHKALAEHAHSDNELYRDPSDPGRCYRCGCVHRYWHPRQATEIICNPRLEAHSDVSDCPRSLILTKICIVDLHKLQQFSSDPKHIPSLALIFPPHAQGPGGGGRQQQATSPG